MELDWDDTSNMFYWKFLHAPIYSAGGELSSRIVLDNATGKYFHLGKNGGVIFENLSAVVSGEKSIHYGIGETPYDFWLGKLGFDTLHICRSTIAKPKQIIGGSDFQTFSITPHGNGFDTTSALPDIDALINKPTFNTVPDPTSVVSGSELTTKLYATEPVLDSIVLNYGFFYVELQAGFQTEIIAGDTTTQNISGILNRYYSLGAYTSGGQETGLVYTHRGNLNIKN